MQPRRSLRRNFTNRFWLGFFVPSFGLTMAACNNAGPNIKSDKIVSQEICPSWKLTEKMYKIPSTLDVKEPCQRRDAKKIFFDVDSSELSNKSKTDIVDFLQCDKEHIRQIEILAYADYNGTEQHNDLLSERRAKTVNDFVKQSEDIFKEKMKATAFGERDATNRDKPLFEQRNVTIKIHWDPRRSQTETSPKNLPSAPQRRGITAFGYYNYRNDPYVPSAPTQENITGGKILGQLDGEQHVVAVREKRQLLVPKDGQEKLVKFFKVEFLNWSDKTGSSVWLNEDALAQIAEDWEEFLRTLEQFENDNSAMTLGERISKLRRLAHKKDLEYDALVGRPIPKNALFRDQRPFSEAVWPILQDYTTVTTPNGQVVDFEHLLVGLDALEPQFRRENISQYGVDAGQSYAAMTWSGDLGSVVADMLVVETEWEKNNPYKKYCDKLKNFFQSRAPVAELLGDLDAWGIANEIDTKKLRDKHDVYLYQILKDFYTEEKIALKRKGSIELFLNNYGFKDPYQDLRGQAAAVNNIKHQITVFSKAWLCYRTRTCLTSPRDNERGTAASNVAEVFLDWVEQQIRLR